MRIEILNKNNVDNYLKYLKKAFELEPEMMIGEFYDEDGIRLRINDPFYMNTKSLLAINDNNDVIGRLEYHFYGCMQDGYRMAYVDWVYVLKESRHMGVAQGLFKAFELECKKNNINQYYLIRAKNKDADKFYKSFLDVSLSDEPLLRKNIKLD